MTTATVLIPSHDHAATLSLTVHSVLAQTFVDLEVLIVGDGVTAEVRDVAHALVATDPRVRFLDNPKGPHHGEIHRDTAIAQAAGDLILYCCDDDLLLPEHVADLVGLLADNDFVQSRNAYVDPDGSVHLYPGDLGDPRFIGRMLDKTMAYTFVSVTGTGHTRAYYNRCGQPWSTTPAGTFPDLHQWQRMLRAAPARAATSTRVTALQFPSHQSGRAKWGEAERLGELQRWTAFLAGPDPQARIDELVQDTLLPDLLEAGLQAFDLARGMQAMRRTVSWRLTAPLRVLRRAVRRGGNG